MRRIVGYLFIVLALAFVTTPLAVFAAATALNGGTFIYTPDIGEAATIAFRADPIVIKAAIGAAAMVVFVLGGALVALEVIGELAMRGTSFEPDCRIIRRSFARESSGGSGDSTGGFGSRLRERMRRIGIGLFLLFQEITGYPPKRETQLTLPW